MDKPILKDLPKDFIFARKPTYLPPRPETKPLALPPIPVSTLDIKKNSPTIQSGGIEQQYVRLRVGEMALIGDEGIYQGMWSPVMQSFAVQPGEQVRRPIRAAFRLKDKPPEPIALREKAKSFIYLQPGETAQAGDEYRPDKDAPWTVLGDPIKVLTRGLYRREIK